VAPLFSSAVDLTVTLTRLGSLGALMEFLLNPVIGKLSDVYGRRALIYWGNLSTVITLDSASCPHFHARPLTHSLTYSRVRSLAHRLLANSLARSPVFANSLTDSLTNTHSLTYSLDFS
jgi:MFS family permease